MAKSLHKKYPDRTVLFKFGKRLAYLRNAQGLTQEKLAEQSSVSVKYIQMLEGKDPNAPTLIKLNELADGLSIPLWKLLKL